MKNKLKVNLIAGIVIVSTLLTACNGGNNSSSNGNSVNSADSDTLYGLSYDPVTSSVFSTNENGALCKISAKNIPDNMVCNLVAPNNIRLASQLKDDNKGTIYALGVQAKTGDNFLLKYHTEKNTWNTVAIDLPFSLSFNKLELYSGNLYLTDKNDSALYKINLVTNKVESVPDFVVPGNGELMAINNSTGAVLYTVREAVESNFQTTILSQTYSKLLSSTASTQWSKYGPGDRNINDSNYVNDTIYACAESDFVYDYHPTGSTDNFSWKILKNGSQPGYFSCDYLASNGNDLLYYVEGKWTSNEKFNNKYVSSVKIK